MLLDVFDGPVAAGDAPRASVTLADVDDVWQHTLIGTDRDGDVCGDLAMALYAEDVAGPRWAGVRVLLGPLDGRLELGDAERMASSTTAFAHQLVQAPDMDEDGLPELLATEQDQAWVLGWQVSRLRAAAGARRPRRARSRGVRRRRRCR